MPRPVSLSEDQVLRLGAGASGALFLGSGLLAADLASEHMRSLGVICGVATQPHCGWCAAAVALGLASLAAFAWSMRPAPRPRQDLLDA